jgi:hypothetical protein
MQANMDFLGTAREAGFTELYLGLLETALVEPGHRCLALCVLEASSWRATKRYVALATQYTLLLVEHETHWFAPEVRDVLTIPWTNIEMLAVHSQRSGLSLSLRAMCEATMVGRLPTRSRGLFAATLRVRPGDRNAEEAHVIATSWQQLADRCPSSRIVPTEINATTPVRSA